MALKPLSPLKLENKLSLLTGMLFFVPLLLASVYINLFLSEEQHNFYRERAQVEAVNLAGSNRAVAAMRAALAGDENLEDKLALLTELAVSRATHVRYVVLMPKNGERLRYPPLRESAASPPLFQGQDLQPSQTVPELAESAGVPVVDSGGTYLGALSLGYTAEGMGAIIAYITQPLQHMMFIAMIVAIVMAIFMAQSIKEILLGLEPEEIATLLQERSAMLQIMNEGVIAVDLEGRVTLVNDEAVRILRLAGLGRATDKNALENSVLVRHLIEVMHSGQAEENDEHNLNGVTLLASHMPVTVNGRVAGAVTTFQDKSEVRRLAERITDINRYVDALRSQSHEFMNKLHVILGMVNNRKLEELQAYINELVDTSTREGKIIHASIKDPVVAGFLTSKYSNARELGVSINFDIQGVLTGLDNAVRNGLITILGNLIDNGMDAVRQARTKELHVGFRVAGGQITLFVADTGQGITEEDQPRIFNKLYTTKGDGRGLGLWLVMKTVDALNGTLELSSTPGQGTRFTITLPLAPTENDAPC